MSRVLQVFEPPDGGVAEAVLTLARGLPDHGWEPVVAGPAGARVRPGIEEAGAAYHPVALRRGYGDPLAEARALRDLLRLVREVEPDVVHVHAAKAGVLGRLAAARRRIPWAYSPHCFGYVGEVGRGRVAGTVAAEAVLGRVGRGAVVCVAEAERREALCHRSAPAGRLEVVHNGTEPCPDAAAEPALAALRDGGALAACVTVLRKQKAVEVFLDAAPRVLSAVPEARLAVVGDGPERDALQRRARELGLDGRFAFLPFTRPAARALRAVDLLVLPSAWEAFPIGVLEAMACGRAVVATDVGGTGEAVEDGVTGRLVAPRDPDALAAAMIELLTDGEKRARMGEAARTRQAERFTVSRMVSGTAAVYERLLARAR